MYYYSTFFINMKFYFHLNRTSKAPYSLYNAALPSYIFMAEIEKIVFFFTFNPLFLLQLRITPGKEHLCVSLRSCKRIASR